MHELDHLIWKEFRLSEGERRFAELSGVTPTFGGNHPKSGTHNSLLSLGKGKYLEIIAPDPTQAGAFGFPKEVPAEFRARLCAFGVRTFDLELVEKLIEHAELSVASVHDVVRESPDGEVLKWKTVVAGSHDYGSFLPFFTQCGEMNHPSETASKGCELLEFSVGHPNARKLSRLYNALQVQIPVFQSEVPELVAILATPKGEVTLRS